MTAIPIITGIGLVTPLGRSAQSTFDALLAGEFISTHAPLEARSALMPRVVSLAIEAADEATKQAGWNQDRRDIAVLACTSKGSIESWLEPLEKARRLTPALEDQADKAEHCFGLSDLSSQLAHHLGSTGPRICISSACASGLHGLIRAAMMIQSGEARRVLIVAAEASVNPLFLASFQRLGVLPAAGELCRPFDLHRKGFLMSEASSAVCLEARTNDNSATAMACIDHFAFGGNAAHLTGSNPDGKVLRYLLQKVIGKNVDMIHAHGTGTIANDSTELAAFDSSQFDGMPHLYSHKAALGHSLGASGLLAVVISCQCHRYGVIPGNINTGHPLASKFVRIERQNVHRRIRRSIVHAAGFGGPTALVSFCDREAE